MLGYCLKRCKGTLLSSYKNLHNYYEVLGLSRSATVAQIKSKYYQLAKMYHPDVCQNRQSNDKFNQISVAYDVLTNDKKRRQYDNDNKFWSSAKEDKESKYDGYNARYRSHKQKQARDQNDEDPFMAYDQYFKKNKSYAKPKRGTDININLSVTLKQAIMGVKKEVSYTQQCLCHSCANLEKQMCFVCGGKKQIFNRIKRQKQQCQSCQGRGYKNQCQVCLGKSYVMKDVSQSISIHKNTHNKNILRFQGLGHHGYRSNNGDLYITVLIEQSEQFRIDGNNIYSQHQLDYLTAILGGKIEIKTVYGMHEIEVQAGTQSGNEIRIFNYGLMSQYSKRKGDHIVNFKIKIPKCISQKQRKLLLQLNQ